MKCVILAGGQWVACFESDAFWLDAGRQADHSLAREKLERDQAQFRMPGPLRGPGAHGR